MRQKVINLVEGLFCRGESFSISDSDSLLENGILNSLGVMELVKALERNFGIRVPPEELSPDNFDSIEGLEAYLTSKGAR